ncbi:tRNA/rRNA methyltransferase (SpoU) [Gloeomargarita lithophora Alchichica-D10]|uniref:tRNA/rRNA methyltransferase (SpoU) n=1 Tax=Gloeomargarita lithophora Alchichica-D10 TaxID=1188229 RepID=A0A1J0AGF2_9CYAN|nr:RNA methyltransferase [Gloeomargarita lithophora]APB35005.1 tRNA/rRNA methyltransferase (SpoU) [Gloeomargarita lithophora Alchichica-D10]
MITSRRHPLVQQIRQLHTPKGRRGLGQFLLEGTHLLLAALEQGIELQYICYTEPWSERYPDLASNLTAPIAQPVSPQVMDVLATTVHPDGVVGVAPIPSLEPLPAPGRLNLLGYRLQDPGNVGTLIRTGAAVGVPHLLLTEDSVDPYHPKVLRSAAGQWFRCPPWVCVDPLSVIKQYQQNQVQIIATHAQADPIYWQVDWTRPSLLLLGNEGQGLPPAWLEQADRVVRLPQQSGVESVNVAVAAAVCLYEALRQGWTELEN